MDKEWPIPDRGYVSSLFAGTVRVTLDGGTPDQARTSISEDISSIAEIHYLLWQNSPIFLFRNTHKDSLKRDRYGRAVRRSASTPVPTSDFERTQANGSNMYIPNTEYTE